VWFKLEKNLSVRDWIINFWWHRFNPRQKLSFLSICINISAYFSYQAAWKSGRNHWNDEFPPIINRMKNVLIVFLISNIVDDIYKDYIANYQVLYTNFQMDNKQKKKLIRYYGACKLPSYCKLRRGSSKFGVCMGVTLRISKFKILRM
jgi:hypothetical protein